MQIAMSLFFLGVLYTINIDSVVFEFIHYEHKSMNLLNYSINILSVMQYLSYIYQSDLFLLLLSEYHKLRDKET